MTTPESPTTTLPVPDESPVTKADAKRLAREAKAVTKANRNWFLRHKVLTGIGTVAALAVVWNIAGGGGSNDETADATNAPAAAVVVEDAPAAAVEEAPVEEAPAGLTGGDYIVGTDIAPGQYRASVEASFFDLCSVSQKNGEDILDIRTATEGSVIFTVQDIPGSVASFDGCTDIVSTTQVPGTAPAQLGNGDWLVGTELTAGQYSAAVDTDALIPLAMVSQSNGTDILDLTTGDTGNVVFTVQDVPGSVVSFSGVKDIQKVG
ncbi:hypothetical protein [Cellulomonas sp. Leaf395]|uniref:hypothetical protein n=1 Tax=Cellulomonas sp. Leaf395 TaxID=1736362 RepID=UPI0006FFCFA1|nr:hypothetical protein [Cellulomonas sp. Leaf395]KQS98456.1 hypothetical protein ASG23_11700 [Cellulomonas sp. Leaf395]